MKTEGRSTRAGRYITQPEGYKAFIPSPLPPAPPITWNEELRNLLSTADIALGRLDGIATILPNPDLFVAMYVRKEAVLSSQIEGTRATLIDIFDYETTGEMVKDVDEIVNYVRAMNNGLERLKSLPLSLRLIREIHEELLKGVRGEHRTPGEFRTTQNWVGPPGSTINDAMFVPPPPHEMMTALGELEKFVHGRDNLPVLIKNALIHAQFETIHPFLDGNGRIGRLLTTLILVHDHIMERPLLCLSYYFKRNRSEYYERLNNIRNRGDWEGWLKFFLKGVCEVSGQAVGSAKEIISLQERDRSRLAKNPNGLKLMDHLVMNPLVTIKEIRRVTAVSNATAGRLAKQMIELGVLSEITGYARNRKFLYKDYFNILKEGVDDD
ncbi:MAG: Fic family protein [Thermodesulfobacteriota bacterium]|nr:Fic family protein [Thermodesulfobacteriota bacterium]